MSNEPEVTDAPVTINEMMGEFSIDSLLSVPKVQDLLTKLGIEDFNPEVPAQVSDEYISSLLAVIISWANTIETPPESLRELISNPSVPVDHLVRELKVRNPATDWLMVIQGMDRKDVKFDTFSSALVLIDFFKIAVDGSQPFPIDIFFQTWENPMAQISFLYQTIRGPISLLNFNELTSRRIIDPSLLPLDQGPLDSFIDQLQAHICNCQGLVEIAYFATQTIQDPMVSDLFDRICYLCPPLAFLGLADSIIDNFDVDNGTILGLLRRMMEPSEANHLAILHLWKKDSNVLVNRLFHNYVVLVPNFMDIFTLCERLDLVPGLVNMANHSIAIPYACLAHDKKLISLKLWAEERLSGEDADHFLSVFIEYVKSHYGNFVDAEEAEYSEYPSRNSIVVIIRCIVGAGLPDHLNSAAKEMVSDLVNHHPEFTKLLNESDINQSIIATAFPIDVVIDSDNLFSILHRNSMPLEEVLNHLADIKHGSPRSKSLFLCFAYTLLEELNEIDKFPEDYVFRISKVLGTIIEHHLLPLSMLKHAVQFISERLHLPQDALISRFCISALLEFKSRIPEWGSFQEIISNYPEIIQSHPELAPFVKPGSHMSGPSTPPIGQPKTPQGKASQPSINQLSLDTLLASGDKINYEEPTNDIQDRIHFIMNNISKSNVEEKAKEMTEFLKESAFKWFGNYLVVKRVSIEVNYHELYLKFLLLLSNKNLTKLVLDVTYEKIHIMLNSEKTATSSSERTLLNSLGSWLGLITLSRNLPILHKKLAIKELLLAGYTDRKLIVVIPFVCKVLVNASESSIFKPPNPWLMGIIRLLIEMSKGAGLKTNTGFAIEVLCKKLEIDPSEVEPTSLLSTLASKSSADLNQITKQIDNMNLSQSHPPTSAAAPSTYSDNPHLDTYNQAMPEQDAFPDLSPYITWNKRLTISTAGPNFKNVIIVSIEQAIKEIEFNINKRAIDIAVTVTKDVFLRDFVAEPNDETVRQATRLIAGSLSSCYSQATSKDALRTRMLHYCFANLRHNQMAITTPLEEELKYFVEDNLPMAIEYIQKTAYEKAAFRVEDMLNPYFISRQIQREHTGHPCADPSYFVPNKYPKNMPDVFKLKPSGLTENQIRVYEDLYLITRASQSAAYEVDSQHAYQSANLDPNHNHSQVIMEQLNNILNELDRVVLSATDESSFHEDFRFLHSQINHLMDQCYNIDEAAFAFTQKLVHRLYKHESALAREVYVVILANVCEASPKAKYEVCQWLTYADDERKHVVPITIALIRIGLIHLPDLDVQLAKMIESGRSSVLDYVVNLIRKYISEKPKGTRSSDWAHCLQILGKLPQLKQHNEELISFWNEVQHFQSTVKENSTELLFQELQNLFNDWVCIVKLTPFNEQNLADYIQSLIQKRIFANEETQALFARICIESCIDEFQTYSLDSNSYPTVAYLKLDAFAKLVVLLVKYYQDPNSKDLNMDKVKLFTRTLSVISLILVHYHQKSGTRFNQKPVFRIFSSILYGLHVQEESIRPLYFQLLVSVANTLNTLVPSFLPGFSFSWLALISHRFFMPKLLHFPDQKGWPFMQKLFCSMFKYLEHVMPSLLTASGDTMYKGILKITLLTYQDFPEFLCAYHMDFMNVIPPKFLQISNLILGSFPKDVNIALPNDPSFKSDSSEQNKAPVILSDYETPLKNNDIMQDLDQYLKTREPISFLLNLRNYLYSQNSKSESSYDVEVINSLVFYTGHQGVENNQRSDVSYLNNSTSMDIFQQLFIDLDPEGKHKFLYNNQLLILV
jgi:CCR4-NOT transcription complex subunit 1